MQRKKNLFALKDSTTGKVTGIFFSNKQEAKSERDRLNNAQPGSAGRFTVAVGPDHKRYKQSH